MVFTHFMLAAILLAPAVALDISTAHPTCCACATGFLVQPEVPASGLFTPPRVCAETCSPIHIEELKCKDNADIAKYVKIHHAEDVVPLFDAINKNSEKECNKAAKTYQDEVDKATSELPKFQAAAALFLAKVASREDRFTFEGKDSELEKKLVDAISTAENYQVAQKGATDLFREHEMAEKCKHVFNMKKNIIVVLNDDTVAGGGYSDAYEGSCKDLATQHETCLTHIQGVFKGGMPDWVAKFLERKNPLTMEMLRKAPQLATRAERFGATEDVKSLTLTFQKTKKGFKHFILTEKGENWCDAHYVRDYSDYQNRDALLAKDFAEKVCPSDRQSVCQQKLLCVLTKENCGS